MEIIIESIRSYDHINGNSDKTAFFAANQSSIQFVEVHIRFENLILPETLDSTELPKFFIQTKPLSQFTGQLQREDSIHTNKVDGFGANVGDTYVIAGSSTSNSTGTVLQVLNNGQTLIVDQNYSSLETLPLTGAYFAITTPQQALSYRFNLIENSEPLNYDSKVDGDIQLSLANNLDYTDTVTNHVATMLGNKSWHFGSITVKGNNKGLGDPALAVGVSQAFIITHELIVAPLMLFDEWSDIQNRIAPDRLLNGNSLKYVSSYGLSVQANNPNDITDVEESDLLSNVGWFNENLNGIPSNYTFDNLFYKRLDSTINTGIELVTTETKIEFSVYSSTNSFSDTNTKIIFGINYAPSDKSQYSGIIAATSQTMEYNFIFDQIVTTLGVSGAVPRQFGTDLQVIKGIDTTFINTGQIDVVVSIEMASSVVSRIAANEIQRYMMYVEVADHTLTRATTDKVQLLLDANGYYRDLTDDGLIVQEQTFLRHPFDNIETETEQYINSFVEADIVGVNNFYIDKNGRESDEIVLTNINSEIIIRKNTGASFVLDNDSNTGVSLSSFSSISDPVYGGIPNTNFDNPRGFQTPVDSNRSNSKLLRLYDLDAGGLFYYRSQFPTRIRWEDYSKIKRASIAIKKGPEFFDHDEPNDGYNNDWIRYDSFVDWGIFYKTTIKATKNGTPLTYEVSNQIEVRNYTVGDEWDTEEIKSFDQNGVELSGAGITYADGRLQANFTFIGVTPPTINDIVIDFHMYVFEEGTFKSLYTMSSMYDGHPDTLFKSIDSSNRTVVTNPSGNIWRGEVLTDGAKIEQLGKFKFTVSALIYDKRGPEPPGPPAVPKLMEDGTPKKMDGSGTFKIME